MTFTRLDADSALNHDFMWSDPMPCSLEGMLATHNKSMFEYNAPTRLSFTIETQLGKQTQSSLSKHPI